MRFAALGIQHETNTFSSVRTDEGTFRSSSMNMPGVGGVLRGAQVWESQAEANTTMGGFFEATRQLGMTVDPIGFGVAQPGGTIDGPGFERILAEQLTDLEAGGPYDGILLAQHGAMVVQGFDDGDAEVIRRVRKLVGPRVPIGVVMDTHGNVSHAQVEAANVTVLWQTNPHIDCRARALECARLVLSAARGETNPVQAIVTPSLAINILCQYTTVEPMRSFVAQAAEIERQPGMLSASVGEGFPYADVPHMGMAFVAIADGDAARAKAAALAMARAAWDRRDELTMKGLSIEAAVAKAAASTDERPVVLLDSGDNVGGGSSGDSTYLLKALLRSGARSFAVTFVDPQVVAACIEAGVGSDVDLLIGGKIDRIHGDPVRIRGRVRLLSDGAFHDDAPIYGGWKDFAPGPTAVIVTPEHGSIVVNSLPIPANSLEQLRSVGLHPESFQAIVAKGVNSPRPAYGPIASQMLLVDSPGAAAADLSTFTYHKRPRPMFPFEDVPRP